MPPRKSDILKVAIGDEGTPAKDPAVREGINVEDLNLPKSIVTRLAKGVLPPNTQIQANAMLAVTKSATVFVNYLATHANENAQNQSRKTINPQDVFKALEDLEFADFKPRLEAELAKFMELQSDKRNTRRKLAADKASGKAGSPQPEDGEEAEISGDRDGDIRMDRDGQPAAKKPKRDSRDVANDSGDQHEGGERDDDEVDDEEVRGDETEEDESDHEAEERLDPDDLEETEEQDAEDEALDNGEDSE